MSQQELVPGPQERGEQAQYSDNSPAARQRYRRSECGRTGDMPKNEHPSTFEDAIPPYAYHAQDGTGSTQQQESTYSRKTHWHSSPAGDAPGNSYRPYRQYNQSNQVPWWARPQRQRSPVLRWVVFILLGIALLHALPAIITVLLALLGLVAFALLLPFLLILGAIAAVAVVGLIILAALGVPVWRRRYNW